MQCPYDGPFKVHDKHYELDVNGHQDSVSIDWLKGAFGKQADCQSPRIVARNEARMYEKSNQER